MGNIRGTHSSPGVYTKMTDKKQIRTRISLIANKNEDVSNISIGGGSSSKTNVTINGNVVEENGLYYVVLNAKPAVLDDITISMDIDGEPKKVNMKKGSDTAKSEEVDKYCKIENVTVEPQSTSVAKYSVNKVVNPNGKGLFNVSVIKVINNEETVVSTEEYKYKDTVKITASDIEGYDFINWDNGIENGDTINIEFEMPEHDVEVRCYYNIKTFTITWLDDDGTTKLASTTVNYGETPVYPNDVPSKVSTEEFNYKFKGWTPNVTAAKENTTYTAEYLSETRQYEILFVDEDGTELLRTDVEYGKTPTYTGKTPTKESSVEFDYTFSGWNPVITEVKGTATYTAQYTSQIRQYNITFIVENDEVIIPVNYGDTPEYPNETPTKESTEKYDYTFAGWDKKLSPVTGEETYTAQFTNTIRKYSLNVEVINGTYTIEEPTPDMYYEYDQNVTIKATSTNEHYTVDGKEGSGTSIEETITIKGNTDKTYVFKINEYDVVFKYGKDNEYSETLTLEYGTKVKEESDKILPPYYETPESGYTFSGWNPEITEETIVEKNAAYTAQYDSQTREYDITFIVGNKKEIRHLPYGTKLKEVSDDISPKDYETAESKYTFIGWKPEITEETTVTGDAIYTAQFEQSTKTYTITWKNYDGTTLETDEDVPYGETPEYNGATPTIESTVQYDFVFSRTWKPEITTVTGDATYTAKYTRQLRQYDITWLNDDNTELAVTRVPYGYLPEYNGATPTKKGDAEFSYKFTGWTPEITGVTGNATYTAQFEEITNTYTVTWKNYDNTVLTSTTVNYGETPVYPKDGPKIERPQDDEYTYTFNNIWDPEITEVTGNAEYTAVFTEIPKEYTLDINVENCTYTIKPEKETYHYNDKVTITITPYEGYEYNPLENIITITGDTTLNYVCEAKKYTLTVDGKVYENIPYDSGITQYLTYEPKEGMSHKWMEGDKEFTGTTMPNRNLILTGVYIEESTESKLVYYGQLINKDAKNMTPENLVKLDNFEYVLGEKTTVETLQPILDPWPGNRPGRPGANQTEWDNNYGAVLYIAVPKSVNVIVKDGIGDIELTESNNILTINNTEYKQYYQTTPYLPAKPESEQGNLSITIIITK